MPFSDVKQKAKRPTQSKFRKTEFMETHEGTHKFRVLDSDYTKHITHYFPATRISILCLGDECPVCQNNKALIMKFPDDFRNQKDYNRRVTRYLVNVFDKTPAKVCTACQKEYKGLQYTFCSCGDRLPLEQTPLNKVKVLSKGESLFADLQAIESAVLDESGEKIGLVNFDINLVVRGSGRDTTYTALPDTNSKEPVNVQSENLFDLKTTVITLAPDEILDVQRGVSLRDIFSARKSKASSQEGKSYTTSVDEETLNDVRAAVDNLFAQ